MALIEYNIQYDDKKETSEVTFRVLEVGGPDKIRFKSNDPKTAIKYLKGTPFDQSDPTAPQADEVFHVGKKTKEFEVVKPLTSAHRLHFKCGEGVRVPAKISRATAGGGASTTNTSTLKLKSWKGSGNGTPPDF